MQSAACPKELTKQHDKSPGVVCNKEKIALILIAPDQWDDNDFTNLAFSKSRLKKGQLSVCRVEHTTQCEVYYFVVHPQLERNPERKLIGAATTACKGIRTISTSTGERVFCVIDDPIVSNDDERHEVEIEDHCNCLTKDYLGHAHMSFSQPLSANEMVAAQSNLKDLFRPSMKPLSIEDVFPACS